jgi:hypothetical protein
MAPSAVEPTKTATMKAAKAATMETAAAKMATTERQCRTAR